MRHLITLLIALAIPLHAAELPRGAERALERYERDAAKAQQAYDEAMADATEDVVEALTKEMDRATRSGDLDTALALRAKVEELTPTPEDGADVAAKEEPKDIRMVVANGTEGLSPIDGPIFSNRDYRLTSVPSQIQGWQIALQAGNAPQSQTFQASGPCTIYVLSTDGSLKGLEQVGKSSYTDPNRTPLYLYEVAYRGGTFRSPDASGFMGASLVVPPTAVVR